MKGHSARVNLWEALRSPQDLHVTSVLSFPNANEKVYCNPFKSISVVSYSEKHGTIVGCQQSVVRMVSSGRYYNSVTFLFTPLTDTEIALQDPDKCGFWWVWFTSCYQHNLYGSSLVGCSLTSHSAIFQLYSDGTIVQFPNFDLLPGTQCHGQLGSLACRAYPDTGTGTALPSEGPHAVRVSRESNPDLPIHSPARYLYAIAAGYGSS